MRELGREGRGIGEKRESGDELGGLARHGAGGCLRLGVEFMESCTIAVTSRFVSVRGSLRSWVLKGDCKV